MESESTKSRREELRKALDTILVSSERVGEIISEVKANFKGRRVHRSLNLKTHDEYIIYGKTNPVEQNRLYAEYRGQNGQLYEIRVTPIIPKEVK